MTRRRICRRNVDKALETLSEDCVDHWVDARLPVFNVHMSNPVDFSREIYSRYHPALLVGMTDHWPATELWTRDYLMEKLGDRKVAINLTPDGMADSVQRVRLPAPHTTPTASGEEEPINQDIKTFHTEVEEEEECGRESSAAELTECFVYPAEAEMTLREFYELIDRRDEVVVPYLSQQNDNLRESLPELLEDIDLYVPLAQQVFGTAAPEAVNLWIGDERSVSSLHKDHFENFYFVISGEKTFTLLPPTDVAFIPEHPYPTAQYVAERDDSDDEVNWKLSISRENLPEEELRWTPLDPEDAASVARYPRFKKNAHPLRVTVSAGETLYIPAMWYHRVSQKTLTVSVNYWYDQRFDFRYVFFKTVQSLMNIANEDDEDDNEEEDANNNRIAPP